MLVVRTWKLLQGAVQRGESTLLPFTTIAEELGVTPQAVRRRVERAIVKLRDRAEPLAA